MRRSLFIVAAGVAALCAATPAASQEAKRPLPTQAQTERWLVDHIEAWDDVDTPEATVSKCIIQRTAKNRSHVLNLKGVLLPIEVLSLDDRDTAIVRVRVREPRSGKFAMSRSCSEANSWCKINDGKFTPERFVEFKVTYYRPYDQGTHRSMTSRKASELAAAINHYVRLCHKAHEEEEELIWFNAPKP